MTSAKTSQLFHSGKRLQKLRELQGLSLSELAKEFNIKTVQLELWEESGVPRKFLTQCCHYFEVSSSIFSDSVGNESELQQLAEKYLFSQDDNSELTKRLSSNRKSKSTRLDLSKLELDDLPEEIVEFTWLIP